MQHERNTHVNIRELCVKKKSLVQRNASYKYYDKINVKNHESCETTHVKVSESYEKKYIYFSK